MGDVGVFSFHGTKTMTTGEGGMLVTRDGGVHDSARVLADHGRDPRVPKAFWCEQLGYKYKMSNLQAALGCAQLERLEELVARKREVFGWYREAFAGLEGLHLNPEPPGTVNSYWMPTLVWPREWAIDRDGLLGEVNAQGIAVRPFFYPVSSFPMFETQPRNTVAYGLYQRAINTPNYFEMSRDDVGRVCDAVTGCLRRRRTA